MYVAIVKASSGTTAAVQPALLQANVARLAAISARVLRDPKQQHRPAEQDGVELSMFAAPLALGSVNERRLRVCVVHVLRHLVNAQFCRLSKF